MNLYHLQIRTLQLNLFSVAVYYVYAAVSPIKLLKVKCAVNYTTALTTTIVWKYAGV